MTRSVACITTSCYKKNRKVLIYWCLFQDNLGELTAERQSIQYSNKARDDGVAVASVGSYAKYLHITTDDHTNTSLTIFAGQMLLLIVNQQCQSSY